MPNWCSGVVNIHGTVGSIKRFLERFLYSDEMYNEKKKRFFARSFVQSDNLDDLEGLTDDEEWSIQIDVDFAWSAYSCMIEGYPQHDPKKLITLAEAVEEDGVDSVTVLTIEPSMGFVERIKYENGICTADCLE